MNNLLRTETYFRDISFWAFYFGDGSGQVNSPLDLQSFDGKIGQAWRANGSWWKEQRAQLCEEPLLITLARRAEVVVLLSLAEEFDLVLQVGNARRIIGNVGGHWILPALRLAELESIVKESRCLRNSAHCALLLLPFVWLCSEDEVASAGRSYATWFKVISPDADEAVALSAKWIRSVAATGICKWMLRDGVWVNDCEESVRNLANPECMDIGRQLTALYTSSQSE